MQKLGNKEGELVTDLVDIATRVQNFYAHFKKDNCDYSVTKEIMGKMISKLIKTES